MAICGRCKTEIKKVIPGWNKCPVCGYSFYIPGKAKKKPVKK